MKSMAGIVCGGIAMAWLGGAMAEEIVATEQDGEIMLEAAAVGGSSAAASSPPAAGDMANAAPQQADTPSTRVPVKAYYEKVDQTRIEQRMTDRAARTQKRQAHAQKHASEQAAVAQQNPPPQQGQDGAGGQNPPPDQ